MPMDKPNFTLFPRFLSLAPPKLWDHRPIRGNQEHKYSAHKGASLTYSGRLSNEGPIPPLALQIMTLTNIYAEGSVDSKAYCIRRILETGCSFKLIGNPQKP